MFIYFKCIVCFISSSLNEYLVPHSEYAVFVLWVVFLDCFIGLLGRSREVLVVQQVKGQKKCQQKNEILLYVYDFIKCSIFITCMILLFSVNGKQSPSKHVKHGQKGASKKNFQHEDAKENSELSNPEDTINTGNIT